MDSSYHNAPKPPPTHLHKGGRAVSVGSYAVLSTEWTNASIQGMKALLRECRSPSLLSATVHLFFPVWELHMDTKKWWILSCGVFPSSTVWRFSEPTVCEIVYMGWCEMLMIWLFLLFILYLFFCITSSFPVDCFTVWEPPSPSLISGWGPFSLKDECGKTLL